jgi:hypothetical protein
VLPPELYDLIMSDVRRGYIASPPPIAGHHHDEHEGGPQ